MPPLKFFSDLIDALGKVAGGLKAIANMPKAERDAIRRALDETFRLIDTTLNMVIIRLGDVLLESADEAFLREVARLDNYNEWMQAEREFRLCQSLRVARREMETVAGQLAGLMSTNDWTALLQQMQNILATENDVALFIGQQFHQHANDARTSGQNSTHTQDLRGALTAFRQALVGERQALIQSEVALFTMV